ncbi:O-antigen ligase family protein [Actinomadura violacea]|uniref:O-antigen ligase family protein n=1 Tax=Actinomadura violacea TaxID=2819934 RepID=A0ABS3S759_9ACTN|nr:O-antigen ligase family protein [Actinomadura violacea]MBO2464848.1 O-antigen ligase family protein [Actinomadura violacea]
MTAAVPWHHGTPRTPWTSRRVLAGLLARPSWLVAATVACVGVPSGGDGGDGAGVQVTVGDCASVAMVAAAVLLAARGRLTLPRRALWAFAPLAATLGVTTVASPDIGSSLPGFVRDAQIFVLVPLAVVLLVRDRRDLGIVFGSVLGLGLGEALYGIWQALSGAGASIGGANVRAVGTFGAVDVMAMSIVVGFAFLVLTAFALVAPRFGAAGVPVALAGLAVLALALLLALSRGSWIALGAGVGLMLVVFDRWLAVKAAVCCAALGLVAFGLLGGGEIVQRYASIAGSVSAPDQSVSDRYNLWAAAGRIWTDHPVTGVGVKNFPAYRDTYAGIELSSGSETDDPVHGYARQPLLSPHDEYLLILSEQGALGFAGFAALLGAIVWGLWTRRDLRDPFWLIGAAFMTFLLVNFLYADMGGPTCVLTGVLVGAAACRAFGLRPGRPEPGGEPA